MESIQYFVDLFLHLDRHLDGLIADFGNWTYLILFLIIFAETGLVFTPFLPGDSLLFVAGALAARGSLNVALLFVLLGVAGIVGDTANYWIGKILGPALVRSGRLLKPAHLEKTHAFFEKYGGKTIIIARFVPIVRTFAPFVAGIGAMTYWKFLTYNVVGGIVWVGACLFAGYFFGNIEIVKKNFSLVVLAIIFISILPGLVEYLAHRRAARRAPAAPEEG
ncbi:MAG: Protein DedA [Phycisphaerae bacterium]|nr:Protein DedA [Phycisphaerae bacterium]